MWRLWSSFKRIIVGHPHEEQYCQAGLQWSIQTFGRLSIIQHVTGVVGVLTMLGESWLHLAAGM